MNSQPNRQLWLPLVVKGELGMCDLSAENPTEKWGLMERIVAPENLRAAYGRVTSNKGAPGIDGMTVEALAAHLRELNSWMMRKLRCFLGKQWGGRGYRELRKRGVSRDLAWNTSKSAHGPWRISMSPALSIALPTRYFVELGLPLLHT